MNLQEYIENEDPNKFWRLSTGETQNLLDEAIELIDQYKIALADAIRRPMGVVPKSAEGLVSSDKLFEAEKRA